MRDINGDSNTAKVLLLCYLDVDMGKNNATR